MSTKISKSALDILNGEIGSLANFPQGDDYKKHNEQTALTEEDCASMNPECAQTQASYDCTDYDCNTKSDCGHTEGDDCKNTDIDCPETEENCEETDAYDNCTEDACTNDFECSTDEEECPDETGSCGETDNGDCQTDECETEECEAQNPKGSKNGDRDDTSFLL